MVFIQRSEETRIGIGIDYDDCLAAPRFGFRNTFFAGSSVVVGREKYGTADQKLSEWYL